MNKKLPRNLIVVYLCIAIAAMGIGLVVPLIPTILVKAHITPSMIGLTTTVMSFSVLIFSLPVGKVIDRYGGKPIVGGGLILYGISMLFFTRANTLLWFMFWRFIEGAGAAAIWVGTETQINFLSNQSNRTKLLGLYATFTGIGFGIGPIIGSLFLQLNNPQIGFYFTFAIIIAALLCLLLFLENVKGKENKAFEVIADNGRKDNITTSASWQNELMIIKIISLSLGAAILYGWMEASISTLLTLYLQELKIYSLKIGITLFVFVLGGVMIPPITGYLADRYGKSIVTLIFTLCLSLTTFLIAFQYSFITILPFAFLTGASGISLYIVALASLGDGISDDKLGTANGYFALCYSIGSIVGPFWAGLGFESIGKEYLFWQISGLAIIYFVFYISYSKFRILHNKKGGT